MPDVKKTSKNAGTTLSKVVRLSGKRTLRWTLRPQRRLSALLLALLANCIPAFMPMARALDLNALPNNGVVRVGNGSIVRSGNQLTVTQSTPKLGIDWNSFNIGANASVNFVQPGASSVALNRVLGNDASQIYGRLSSNGQVFLTNPNGVLFAPGAKVDVGGLVASSLDLTQENFALGNYRFSGGTGSVTNQGSLHAAPGGYIGLFGSAVNNQGQIEALAGSVVLASGSAVTVGIDQSGLFSAVVTPATASALVSNSGSIQADGGSVRLDVQTAQGIAESLINNSGVIRASSIENRNGEIWLTGAAQISNTGTLDVSAQGKGNGGVIVVKADMQAGSAQIGGSLLAQGGALGGDGGSIETSGAHVHIAPDAVVKSSAPLGKTGQWLIDPADFVVSSTGGDLTGAALATQLLSNNVTLDSDNGGNATTGSGDITVSDAVSWSGANSLTLNALRNVNINANISNSGGAQLALRSDKNGTGTGTVIFGAGAGIAMGTTGRADLYYNPTSYAAPTNYASNLSGSTNATAWMLVNDIGVAAGTGKGLQAINTNLAGSYALGKDIDASGTSTWNTVSAVSAGFTPIGNTSTAFTGRFDGLGHSISGLTINRPGTSSVGMFGYVNSSTALIQNVNLVGGSISGSMYVGALAGQLASGSITNANSSANVTGVYYYIGGLVGVNAGTVKSSSASGVVSNTASGYYYIGGLAGYNSGSIDSSYSSSAVSGTGSTSQLGGLVGYQYYTGSISNSYATGIVSGGAASSYVGGLIGYAAGGTVSNSYASNAVSGSSSVGAVFGYSGATLTNVNFNIDQSTVNGVAAYGSYTNGSNTATGLDAAQIQEKFQHNGVLSITNYASSLVFDSTSGSYGINSVQGMKDMLGFAGNASYKFSLSGNVDLVSVPGYYIPSFTAQSFNGNGYTISNLSVPQTGASNVGFIGTLGAASSLSNLVLSNVNVNGASYVGGAVGQSLSPGSLRTTISGVSVSGSVVGTGNYVGGVAGSMESYAGIASSSSAATVQGTSYLGGLVGNMSYAGALSNTFATGAVSAGNSASYVGGLVGYNYASNISDSYASGTVTVGTNVYMAGGLVGYNPYSNLTRVYASGNVTGGNTGQYLGGLVGYMYSGTISSAYATGSVSAGNSTYVGGLGGYVYSSVTNAYAKGAVTGGTNVGPLFGSGSSVTISNVMYDIDTSTVNGQQVYGPGGFGNTQFLEILSTGTLNIQNYSTTLPYDSNSGSYVISSLQGLKDMLGFATFSAYKFSLAADLDLSSMPGFNVPSFSANSFNGNNHTLSNLTLSPTANPWVTTGLGLFSSLGGASSISNLTLSNVNVSALSGTYYVGALVGQAQSPSIARTMISNVNVSGVVSVASGNYVGGVVGQINGAGGIDNAVSSASVSGYQNIGGVVGYNAGTGAITNSSASGAISGSYTVGGLVGYNSGSISGSSASGTVTGTNNSNNVGGLAGYSYGAVSTSYATGNVAVGTSAYYVGGLIGNNNGAVSNAYATGTVGGGASSSYLGGLIGYNSGALNTVYATGAVTVRDASNSNNSTNISGNYVGGLAGYNTAAVSNSYSSGAVTGATNTAVLFGANTATSISNVFYNIDSSTVNGNSYVGPYGIYTAQFQDWISHALTLDITHYTSLPFDSTSGSYLISNLQGMKDLLGFAGNAGYKFTLTANVDLSGVPGYYIPVFTAASFNGNNNTLSNLSVNQPTVNNIGFIGTLGGTSSLSNLNLDHISVTGQSYVGGAVGQALAPTAGTAVISNVNITSVLGASSVTATYTSTISQSGYYAGGVVGYLNNYAGLSGVSSSAAVSGLQYVGGVAGQTNYGGTVTNSHASGVVTSLTSSSGAYGGSYLGGLVGYNYYTTISNSYATGNVVDSTGSYANGLGGLVGYNYYGSITNSYASGAVSGGNNATYIGGLVGLGYGSVSASYASGNVSAGVGTSQMGGLVGYNGGAAISSSYATGAVSAGLSSSYIGGLVGNNSGTLTTTYATGAVTVRDASNSNNSTNISGNYVGGLAGNNTAAVSNSYSSGAVTGATNVAVLFGANTATSISNVFYNIDTSTVNGNSYVGPYGIYTAQFQDWTSHNLTLDITRYASLPVDSNGNYLISTVQGMKDLLGFAGNAGYKFKLTANLDLSVVPGYYIPVFTAASFDGGNNTLSHLNVNQPLVNNIGFIGTLGGASTLSNLVLANLSVSGGSNVGGAVGSALSPSTTTAVISNVSVSGTVTGVGNYVGGVAGYLNTYAGLSGVSSSATVQGVSYVGGAAGYVTNASVSNSSATGNVTGGNGGSYVGGLLGQTYSATLNNDYATGSVAATTGSLYQYVGGLVGSTTYGVISNSYATGAVHGGTYYTGGLVGYASSTPISTSYATGNVTGTYYVGGLAGIANNTISGSFATGTVSGYYVSGGLVGEYDYGSLSNSYATGAVSSSYNYGGGLVGYQYYGSVNTSYATGAVTGGSNLGGLIGYQTGATFANSYWNTTTSGRSTSAGGTGLTTAQMQMQASYSGWDFANTWKIYEGNTYPLLQAWLKPVTITAGSATKAYDQLAYSGTLSNVTYSDPSAIGQLQGTLVVVNNAQGAVNAGTYTVTPSGLWSNSQFGYNISYVAGSLTVTPRTVTVSGITAADKVYDGTLVATVNGGALDSTNVLAGDVVSVTGMLGSFADKNVANGIAVTVPVGTHLGGLNGINYLVSNASVTSASITPKSLTVSSVTASSKVYDGTTSVVLSGAGALSGVVQGDTVTLSGLTGSFADKNVGTGKSVSISGGVLTGAQASNYQLGGTLNTVATADITALAITSSGITAQDKVYDRSTTATLNTASGMLNGVLQGDTVSLDFSAAAGSFADKNVGSAKAVTISGMALTGSDAQNYTFTDRSAATASITPKSISISGAVASNRAYNGTNIASISGAVANGVIQGDSTNTTSISGLFDTKNVGNGKTVTLASNAHLGGTDGANYVVNSYNPMSANITAFTLHVTSVTANSKVYDGTTLATVNGGLLTGVVGTDNVTLTNVTGMFSDKNVGTAKTVTFSGGALTGTDASNYQLAGPVAVTSTANITARALVVSGITALDKVYDRSTTATLNTSGWSVSGLVTGDAVSVNINSVTGTFANKNVGVGKAVAIGGLGLTGADAGNYSVSYPAGTVATITAAPVILTGYVAANKVYDGTLNATVTGGTVTGVLAGDSVITASLTGLFDSKAAGTNKPVTMLGVGLGGTDGANYTVISANAMSANITPKLLTTSTLTALNKVYDGTLLASLSGGTLSGVVFGDNVSLTALSGLFADKNVGTGKTVTISGGALTGSDANNYVLSSTFASTTTASITARVLSTTGITAQDKVYDRTSNATISTASALVNGVIMGDNVTVDLSGAIGSFANKNVGTSKVVTVSGLLLGGTDASNYSIVDASNPTASITPVGVTLSGYTASSKVYDGSRIATVLGGSVSGVLAGDTVISATLSGLFDTKNAGVAKTVTLVGSALGGVDGGNYVVTGANTLTADITPKTLTASAITVANKIYDGTTTAAFSGGVLSGKVGSDNVDLTAVTALFANKNVGIGKTVTISGGALTGVDAGNYQLLSQLSGTTTANISPLGISTIGITAQDKVYDRSASATINTQAVSLRGVLGSDNVSLDLTAVAGNFADKNVGVAKPVLVSGLALSGADAQNYTVSDASNATASITPVGVSLTGYIAASKVYDGTRTAVVSGGVATGMLPGDSVNTAVLSGLFDTKNVGTGKTVTIVGSTLAGVDGANYLVTSANALAADITPKNLTVSSVTVANKVYDGTLAATFSGGLLSGVVSGDAVGLTSISASFADKNVGIAKTVTISGGALTGVDVANYQLVGSVPTTSSANITPLAITASGITAQNRVYDRSTTAQINTSGASLQGALAGDTVTLVTSSAAGSFADKNAGIGKAVTVSGLVLSGADANNYSLSDASHASATVTPLGVSITGASAASRVYDGSRNATISGASVTGVLSGDSVSVNSLIGVFGTKNVGTGKSVSLSGLGLGGTDGGNYVITSANAVTANITPKTLVASAVTALDKIYDGSASATLNGGVLSGWIVGDVVSLSGLSGSFADKIVGAHKTVTITAGGLTGADAGNYLLSNNVSGVTTASITPRTLTTSGISAQDKVYDQTTLATINTSAIALNNIVSGDTVLLDATGAVGNFANKNVGVGKAISVSGLLISGADAQNYVVSTATGATASITPKAVSLSNYAAIDKVYDGTTVATLIGGAATGLIAGDLVSASVLSGQFADKNVGANKTVTVSGITLSGADGGNYVVAGATPVSASIFPRTLTLNSLQASDKVYDGTVAATVTGVLANVVNGDSVALSNLGGVFTSKNAGVGKTVTISGGNLSGADAGNYQLAGSVSGTTTATITPLTLTLSGITASDKVYDRSTAASLDVSGAVLQGVLGLDTVNLNLGAATGSFANKNVGSNKAVTVSGLTLTGADAGNYLISNISNTAASITARSVTITGAAGQNRAYDGTTNAVVSGGYVSGVLAGDVVSLSALVGQFADKNVGTGKTITLANAALGGTDGGNYSITNYNPVSANITYKIITVSGASASDKVYDGTNAATLIGGVLSGVVNGDVVNLTGQSGTFADKNAGVGKAVNFSGGSLTGADASNYQLSGGLSGTATATITPLGISVSGITALDKAYDRSTVATLSISNAALQGVLNSDSVGLDVSAATANFVDKNVGANKAIVLSGVLLTGIDGGNYSIANSSGVTASITPLSVTITGATAQNKVYDGTLNAVAGGGVVTGVLPGDVVSLSALNGQFADKNVGNGKAVTLVNATLGGADGGNYLITGSNPMTANITPKPITVAGVTVSDKVYDGKSNASVSAAVLNGIIGGDQVSATAITGVFQDVNVGANKQVILSGGSLTGTDAANYLLSGPVTLANLPSITPRPVVVAGNTEVVAADQLGGIKPGWSVSGLVDPDTFAGVTLAPAAVDVNASPGTVQVITPSGGSFTAGLAGNYSLSYANGYVVVLPTQSSALAGDTGNQNVFYIQLNANQLNNALQAVGNERSNVGTGAQPLPPGPYFEPFGSSGPFEGGEDDAQGAAQDYQQAIPESTPAAIDKLRRKPLLLWDRKFPEKRINLSDSGVTH